MTLPEDTILENRYRIDRLLGQGGMGAIYRGFDIRLNRAIAVKENFFQTAQAIRQFEREAIMLADLTHPNLPRVGDHFSFEGQQYLVMDFIEGYDLWEMIKQQQRPLPETQAIDYIIQVCGAVRYLHERNPPIIHRDIKPQNIKITPSGRAVLVDFGIAKIVESGARTSTGARGVTPGFSSPEQYSGAGTTPLSDIYSLGATLYAILTGKKPPDSISLLTNRAKFKSPIELNAKLSQQVSQAVMHAVQLQQADRPQSVAAWQQELKACLEALAPTVVDDDQTAIETVLSPGWLVDSQGQGYQLKPGSLLLGRAKSCDIRINDPLASREHATLEFDGQTCTVYDEGSANGTYINGQKIGTGGNPFSLGDQLRIGQATFSLSSTAPEPGVQSFSVPVDQVDEQAETAYKATRMAPPPIPSTQSPSQPLPVAAAPPARSVKSGPPWGMIAAGVIVLLVIIATAVFFIMMRGGGDTTEPVAMAPTPTAGAKEVAAEPTKEPTATTDTEATIAAAVEATRRAEPTGTPEPTDTSTPEPTEIPTPGPTSTRIPTPTQPPPTNTPIIIVATATSPPTSAAVASPTAGVVANYQIPELIEPPEGFNISNQPHLFVWEWPGSTLADNHAFEVRIWQEGEPHYGAFDARETSKYMEQQSDSRYALNLTLSAAYSVKQNGNGEYFWSVAIVELEPYQSIVEASPRAVLINVFGGGGGGGGSGGYGGSSGGGY